MRIKCHVASSLPYLLRQQCTKLAMNMAKGATLDPVMRCWRLYLFELPKQW